MCATFLKSNEACFYSPIDGQKVTNEKGGGVMYCTYSLKVHVKIC